MYRPQFPISTPPGFEDKDSVQYFDQTSVTQLNAALSLAAGGFLLGIPLQLQADAPFTWRGIKVNGPSNFSVRFRDTHGNYLSSDWITLPLDYSPNQPTVAGSPSIPFEPAIPCQAGSVILVDVKRIS